ncbi:MAG: hypothetical protein INR64_04970 [Caulobacteraceae bacterium]|nr:hypothetical protein [Caulobacter sp.]
MTVRFVRRRRLPDGRVELFTPKLVDGYFVLADRAVDAQHNKAANEFYVRDPSAVAARLRRGGVSMRMVGDGPAASLISAARIEIVDDEAPRSDPDGDPFACFTEWSEAADEEAWRDL